MKRMVQVFFQISVDEESLTYISNKDQPLIILINSTPDNTTDLKQHFYSYALDKKTNSSCYFASMNMSAIHYLNPKHFFISNYKHFSYSGLEVLKINYTFFVPKKTF